MKYRLIESRFPDEDDWTQIEVVYEDPDLGVTRFRPQSRHAFRVCDGPIEGITAEVAREPGIDAELRISDVYEYSGRFDPLEPDILFEEAPVLAKQPQA